MSLPALQWAMRQRAVSSAAKFLLVMLGDCASVGDWLAWPSVGYLSFATQQDRKTVLANLRKLEEQGLIVDAGRTGKTGQVTIWKLPVQGIYMGPNDPENGTLCSLEDEAEAPGNSTAFPAKESQISAETVPILGHGTSKGTSKGTKEKRARRASSKPEATFSEWIAATLEKGEKPIPASDSIHAYAEKAKLGAGFLELAWLVFKDRFLDSQKTYADWRATFRNYVKNDYLKLWRADHVSGQFVLTTAGVQAAQAHGLSHLLGRTDDDVFGGAH